MKFSCSGLAFLVVLLVIPSWPIAAFAENGDPCDETIDETFDVGASGELFSAASLVNVGGYPRLKLVADGFPGTWGTWVSPAIDETVKAFDASFRFSLKNLGGAPGDGFSFLWGDLSNTSGTRMSGGEWGTEGFVADGAGLSVGFASYPAGATNGVNGRWGGVDFAFTPFDYTLVRYDDYVQAADPQNMATATVRWTRDAGITVTIALPTFPPQVIYVDQGQDQTEDVDPTGWSFGFAARNGGIDQDVLIGDLIINVEVECPEVIIPEDLNGDCLVSGADLGLLLSSWGTCTSFPCLGDINGDGEINGADLGQMLGAWGNEAECKEESPGDRAAMRPLGTTPAGQGFWEYLPENYQSRTDWALMISLHGVGSNGNGTSLELDRVRGDGPPGLISIGNWPPQGTAAGDEFVVLSPQNATPYCHDADEIDAFIRYALTAYAVDPERVYLTGLSCGGIGTWEYLRDYLQDDLVAAVVPICGDGRDAWKQRGCELGVMPIWAFHGDQDDSIDVEGTLVPMNGLAVCSGPLPVDARSTIYQGAGHDVWTTTYDMTSGNDIYAWMLTHRNP